MASTQGRGASREREGRSAGNGSGQRGPRNAQRTLANVLKGQRERSVDGLPGSYVVGTSQQCSGSEDRYAGSAGREAQRRAGRHHRERLLGLAALGPSGQEGRQQREWSLEKVRGWRAAKNMFKAFGETLWRKTCIFSAKILKCMGETSSRRYNWSRRQRVGILAMAPPCLEEIPGKTHASHQSIILFQLLEHLSCGEEQEPLWAVLTLYVFSLPRPRPGNPPPRILFLPKSPSLPSRRPSWTPIMFTLLSPIHTPHACSPCTMWLPVDSSWIPLSHA